MKIALLSDVHANLRAWQACLDHARSQGATRFALLGDYVGYGAEPGAVTDAVRALVAEGAIAIGGNHDQMAVNPPTTAERQGQLSAAWTHAQLDAAQRDFLAALPLTHVEEQRMLVHASADAPERWRYADEPAVAEASLRAVAERGIRHLFVGHVHQQLLFFRGADGRVARFMPTAGVAVPVPPHRQWLATVGSVGQPRDGDPRAMYALFDATAQRLCFHRVAYDHLAAAAAIRAAGLDPFFADRLERGE
jgi:diadenosine tetraphosphatase ApaH/serine/threonine PP2A family protein phosphatase